LELGLAALIAGIGWSMPTENKECLDGVKALGTNMRSRVCVFVQQTTLRYMNSLLV